MFSRDIFKAQLESRRIWQNIKDQGSVTLKEKKIIIITVSRAAIILENSLLIFNRTNTKNNIEHK